MNQYKPLGEMLVSERLISQEQLDLVLHLQQSTNKRVGQLIVENGFAKEEDVAQCIAQQFGLDYLSPSSLRPTVGAISYVTASTAREHMILPLEFQRGRLLCAIVDPVDVKSTDEICHAIGIPLDFVVTSPTGLLRAIAMAYEEPLIGSPAGYSPYVACSERAENSGSSTIEQPNLVVRESDRNPESFFAAIGKPMPKVDETSLEMPTPLEIVENSEVCPSDGTYQNANLQLVDYENSAQIQSDDFSQDLHLVDNSAVENPVEGKNDFSLGNEVEIESASNFQFAQTGELEGSGYSPATGPSELPEVSEFEAEFSTDEPKIAFLEIENKPNLSLEPNQETTLTIDGGSESNFDFASIPTSSELSLRVQSSNENDLVTTEKTAPQVKVRKKRAVRPQKDRLLLLTNLEQAMKEFAAKEAR